MLNLKGIYVSAKFVAFCTIIGMAIPRALIIGLAIMWIVSGNPLQIHFTDATCWPSFSHIDSWVSLTAIMTAFAGMELAAVHVKEIDNPQKSFPRALYISVWLVLTPMILGSLALAVVLPKEQIKLVNGIMQAFSRFFAAYHISWVMPIMTIMVLVGTLGSMSVGSFHPLKVCCKQQNLVFYLHFFKK